MLMLHSAYSFDVRRQGRCMHGHVRFEEFWSQLKNEFGKAPGPEPGIHVLSFRKWTQGKGYLPTPPFTAIWKGEDVIYCDTEKTHNWRAVPATEFPQGLRGVGRLSGRAEGAFVHRTRPRGTEFDVDHSDLIPLRTLDETRQLNEM